jgi:tyrosine-protein phosphatase YwqE
MGDLYKNTPEGIVRKLDELHQYLTDRNVPIQVEAAAEYYLDENLIRTIEENNKVLTFGEKYLLFETNFKSEPLNLKEFIFMVITRGYIPVLAHPERYHFLHNNLTKVNDLVDRGVLLQMNIGSILGFYSKEIQSFASKLINLGHIHFLGSDCHNIHYAELLTIATKSKQFRKAVSLPLLNNTL